MVRESTKTDLSQLLKVEQASHRCPWSSAQLKEEQMSGHCFVFDHPERGVAGFLFCRLAADEMEITNLAVFPAERRNGIASALIRHCFDFAAVKGVQHLFLEVRQSNQGAMMLYRTMGFLPYAERKRYYPDGEGAILMKREPASED